VCLAGAVFAQIAQQLKDGEFEPYNSAINDLNAGAFSKALDDLDVWKDKFPASDLSDTRIALYVQTYSGLKQPEKALDAAQPLLTKDLKAAFAGPDGQAMIIRLLYNATGAISHAANPTPSQLASGETAARELMAYDDPLPGVPADKWAEARADMKDKAAAALLYIDMLPGIQAMAKRPPDCPAAEAAYLTALKAHPDQATISYELGRALNCQAEVPQAIYEFERAAVTHPSLGEKVRAFADGAYIKFHGSDEGLADLKGQVRQSPLPPDGFTIKTAAEIAAERQAEFDKAHPELAVWRSIRDSLTGDNAARFFDSQLKDAELPKLKGTLVESKPACRPRELFIAIEGARPQVLLKLAKPLTGKPELGGEIEWEGSVGVSFAPQPFQLTLDADAGKIEGLKLTPCAPARR
jgi:tetratricopeptide (TPR) repeat protein